MTVEVARGDGEAKLALLLKLLVKMGRQKWHYCGSCWWRWTGEVDQSDPPDLKGAANELGDDEQEDNDVVDVAFSGA